MTAEPLRGLGDAEVEAYRRAGVACLRRAFEPFWLAVLAQGVERNLAEPGRYAKHYTPDGRPGDPMDCPTFPVVWPRP